MDQSHVPSASPVPEQLGPCRLIRPLGAGGMGQVYLAELMDDRAYAPAGTRVAVKILHPALVDDPQAFERFAREGLLGQTIDHPIVVRTYEAGTSRVAGAVHHYLVMEYVEGKTLAGLVGDLKVVPEPLLRALALQIARGLVAIHAAGVVHRDLKPANVLITPGHEVKIMDLGTARLLGEAAKRLTRAGAFVGTLLYGAPEQLRGDEVGPATDLYALGVMLYEAATGIQPFDDRDLAGIIRRHLEHDPVKAGSLNPQLSPYFEELIHALIAKEPGLRLGPAAFLAHTLEAGESAAWWRAREGELRTQSPRNALRRIKVPRWSALVGRLEELQLLRSLYAEARSGHGRLLLIEGEAGVGKTRLLDAFLETLEAAGEAPAVLYGASAPGGSGGVRGALAESVVDHLGLAGLGAALERHLALVPRLAPSFASFLSGEPLPEGTEPLSVEAVQASFCHLARGLAAARPTLWIVEDLHFARAERRAPLLALARIVRDQRLLLIATFRPGQSAEDLAALTRLESTRKLVLGRLARDEAETLAAALLGGQTAAASLSRALALKSDGNPFFLLEALRELQDRGDRDAVSVTALDVPATVRDLLVARLKEIRPRDRDLLDVAAVLGFNFDPLLIARVLGRPRLEVLQALSAIERRSGLVRASGRGFEFDHHQLQEVVYQAVPPALRAEYHALLAAAYEKETGLAGRAAAEVPGEDAVFLAEHYLKGGRSRSGLGYVLRALEHHASRYNNQALLELADEALVELAPEDAALRCDIRLAQSACLDLLGRRAAQREAVEDARAAAEAAGDEARQARALVALVGVLTMLGEYQTVRPLLERARRAAQAVGDGDSEAQLMAHFGSAAVALGHYDEAQAELSRYLAFAHRIGHVRHQAAAEGHLAMLHIRTGDFAAARAHGERELALAEEGGDRRRQVLAIGRLGTVAGVLNRYAEAKHAYARCVQLASEIGYTFGEASALLSLGDTALRLGQLGEARRLHERCLVLFREVDNRRNEVYIHIGLADTALQRGDLDEAAAQAEVGLRMSRALGTKVPEGFCLLSVGDVWWLRGERPRSGVAYQDALVLARRIGDLELLPQAALSMARWLIEEGERARARPLLEEADGPMLAGLPAAYLALIGARAAGAVTVPELGQVHYRAEAHVVLHRAGAGSDHLELARVLLEEMAASLEEGERAGFWRDNMVARMYRAERARE